MLFIKRFLNLDTFRTLLNAFVLSIIDYGLIIWGKVSVSKIKILQGKVNNVLGSFFYPQICNRFQRVNKIAHFYENKSFQLPTINYYNLYEQCNIFTIEERLLYFYGIFCFKSIRNNHIPELKESFKFSHSARSQNISILQHHSDFFEKSAIYQSALVWNRLPNEAKELGLSLSGFKGILTAWLLQRRLDDFVSN